MCTGAEVALIGGGLLKGAGSYQEGQFAADMAGLNEDIARYSRRSALARGEDAVRQVREQARSIIGAQAVGYATQNVAIDSGSAVEVRADTAYQTERAVSQIRNNAMLEAWGYKMQGLDFGLQAQQAKKGGVAGALGSVLGSVGQAFG